jgi:hypothetical protein
MTDVAFKFIGWCNEIDRDGHKHDKIWGYFTTDASAGYGAPCYIFWGARDKKNTLRFKEDFIHGALEQLARQKQDKKNYNRITEKKLLEIWPDFYDQMEMKLTFAVLANKVM